MFSNPGSPMRPLTDVVVAINPGAAGPLGIIGVHRGQAIQADVPVELVNHAGHALRVGEVITGGEGVLRVQANAQAGAVHGPGARRPAR